MKNTILKKSLTFYLFSTIILFAYVLLSIFSINKRLNLIEDTEMPGQTATATIPIKFEDKDINESTDNNEWQFNRSLHSLQALDERLTKAEIEINDFLEDTETIPKDNSQSGNFCVLPRW